jgi:hypothetical protein
VCPTPHQEVFLVPDELASRHTARENIMSIAARRMYVWRDDL